MSRARVGIVNDLKLAREVLREIVASDTRFEVCWYAEDGVEAIARCAGDPPDIVLMDLLMPKLDGVGATRAIMAATPCPILVVTATVQGNLALVYEAMGLGALDAVMTPTRGNPSSAREAQNLLRKMHAVLALARGMAAGASREQLPEARATAAVPQILAIGSSTGGPAAVETILRALPGDFPAAILVAQHIDKEFVQGFVDWLRSRIRLGVRLARQGEPVQAAQVFVANSHAHMVLGPGGHLGYVDGPPGALYRPSVDVLFDSVSRNAPSGSTGVLLTGIGRDGASGLLAMRRAGLRTIAQDRDSCVVYGMPAAAAEIGAAEQILPVDRIAAQLLSLHTLHTLRSPA